MLNYFLSKYRKVRQKKFRSKQLYPVIYVVLDACKTQLINHLRKEIQPESRVARAHLCHLRRPSDL